MHNVGLEHSLYTTGPNLLKIISDKNINTAHTRNDYTKFNFAKDGEGTPDGESAVNVKVTFPVIRIQVLNIILMQMTIPWISGTNRILMRLTAKI